MSGGRGALADAMREQAGWCERLGSPFYRALLLRIAGDIEQGGVCWRSLEARAADPKRLKLPLRFLGRIHRLVLEGRLPALARHYPSAGGDGDAEAAWQALCNVLSRDGSELCSQLPGTVQYSEPKRSTALLPGFLEVARRTRLPLRLLELGSGSGLNLRWDHYRYEAGRGAWGPADSLLVFRDAYSGEAPPFDIEAHVVERRGCDLNPIDPTTEEGRLTLKSFLWPDQPDRFDRLAPAIEVARRVPVTIDRAEAVEWLERQLAHARRGVATVVFQSIVLLYFSAEARARLTQVLTRVGSQATMEAPLAWISMEPEERDDGVHLTLWPGGERRPIARAGFHGGVVAIVNR